MPISQIVTNSIAPSQTLTTPIIATTMGVGGATPANSGSGITFPAAQSASSDVNTLDDYEEGTWTPTDASGASLSFVAATGNYTKIGNMVFATFSVTYPTTANGTANLVGGLPFTSSASNNGQGGFVSVTGYATAITVYLGGPVTAFSFRTFGNTQPANAAFSTFTARGCVVYFV